MSILDRLGAAVGIGNSTVQIDLDPGDLAWGGEARGTLTIAGGHVEQQVERIRVSLLERWETQDHDGPTETHYREHSSEDLPGGFPLRPGETRKFAFAIPIPMDLALQNQWLIRARLSVPGGVDPHEDHYFPLLAPAPFGELSRVLAQVSGIPPHAWHTHGSHTHVEHRPDGVLKEKLDGVRLEMQLVGDRIEGWVEVNLREHTLAEHLRAMVHADRIRFPISVPAGDCTGAAARLSEILEPFLAG